MRVRRSSTLRLSTRIGTVAIGYASDANLVTIASPRLGALASGDVLLFCRWPDDAMPLRIEEERQRGGDAPQTVEARKRL